MKSAIFNWIKFWFAALFMPVSILLIGSLYMSSLQQKNKLATFAAEGFETLETMRYVADTEQYLCNSINELFLKNADPEKLEQAVSAFLAENGIKAEYFIWNENGEISRSNFAYENLQGDLRQAFFALNKIRKDPGRPGIISADEENNLRQLFGRHFFPSFYSNCFTGRFRELLRTDAARKKPLTWMNVAENIGLCVLLDYDVLDSDCGLKALLKNNKRNLIPGYVDKTTIHCSDSKLASLLKEHLNEIKIGYNEMFEVGEYRVLINYLSGKSQNFCAVKPEMLKSSERLFWFNFARAIFVVIILLFTFLSFRVIVLNQKLSLKITAQLLLLFTVSNLLPGYVMLVICSDFLQQLKKSLIVEAFNQSNFHLQKVDELYISEYTQQKRSFDKVAEKFRANLKKARINRETMRSFVDPQFPEPMNLFLVASSSNMVAGSRGIVENGEVKEAFYTDFRKDSERINIMTSLQKLGLFLLKRMNEDPVPNKLETEVEFIGESLFQKRPFELVKHFSGIHFFADWTLGKRNSPFYIEFFRLFDPDKNDYLMVYFWDMYDLEMAFVARQFFNLNRNNLGLKVFAIDERIETSFPPEALEHEKIREIAFKLRDRNLTRPEYIRYEDQDFLLTGYKCLSMMHMRLLALYPLEKINAAIDAKWKILLKFVLISLLISVFLGLSVAGSIVRPLVQLQQGVEALNNRNFSYRLPELGKDEFGHLAAIFNETLVDLEEMQAAKIVQEKLLVPMTEKLLSNNFLAFGKTESLSGMGGDYFEHFTIDEGKTSFLLGDVAGRGVSNSLILAFVKSAVNLLQSYEASKFMSELNRMLLESSRTRQAKSFACQLVQTGDNGLVTLANAGLPYPVLVDHRRRCASVIELPALPLGRTKKWRPVVSEIRLEPETSIVCFSSGFLYQWQVEYSSVVDMVVNSIDPDPEKFCENCFEQLFTLIDKKSCNKDVSILVISRINPEATLEQSPG